MAGVLTLTALVGVARTRAAGEALCSLARQRLPRLLHLDVGINRCEIDPLTQSVSLTGLSLFKPGTDEAIFWAESAVISLKAYRPPSSIDLSRVAVTRPRLRLDLSTPAAPRDTQERECPLAALRRARVDELEVRGGSVRVALPKGRRLLLEGLDLGWTLRRGVADLEVQAQKGRLALGEGAEELSIGRVSVQGGLDVDDEAFELTRGELSLDAATLSASGRVDALCDPRFALEATAYLPASTLARFTGQPHKVAGQVWSRLTLGGALKDPRLHGEVVGSGLTWGRFAPGDFRARLELTRELLTLHAFEAQVEQGTVRLAGELKLQAGLPLKVKVDADQAPLAAVLARAGVPGAWVDFPATVHATLQGKLRPSLGISGDAELRSGPFALTPHPHGPLSERRALLTFPKASGTFHVALRSDRVDFTQVKLEVPATAAGSGTRAQAEVTLFYDVSRGLSLSGRLEALDLSDFGPLGKLRWAGKGNGRFAVEGPYHAVRVDADFSLRDLELDDYVLGVVQGRLEYQAERLAFPAFTAQKGRTGYGGDVELRFPSTGVTLSARLQAGRGRTEDLIDLVARTSSSVALLQGDLSGDATALVTLDGPLDALHGKFELSLKDTRYLERRLGDGKVVLTLDAGRSLSLQRAALQGPLGTTTASGRYVFSGPLDYRFRVDGGSLPELWGPERAGRQGVNGVLTLVGKVEGDSTTPLVSGYLTSPKVTFAGRALGPAHLEGRVVGKDLQVWGKPFEDAGAQLKLKLKEPFAYDGSLTLALPEVRPLLPAGAVSQGLSGSLAGTLTAQGALRTPGSLQGTARFEKLVLARGEFVGRNDGPIALRYEKGQLAIESLRFLGPNTQLTAGGTYGPDDVDVQLEGALDMRLLESFLPQLERTAGRVELTASATGPVKNPSIAGRADIRDTRLSIRDQPYTLRALSGRVEFSEARVLVQEVFGVLNDGRLSARGDLRLEDFALKQVEVSLGLEDVALRPLEDLPLTASGELLLTGRPGDYQLSGGLDVVKLRYERILELNAFLRTVKSPRLPGSAERPREWLRFDVDVAASGDVRVENNLARAGLEGKLKLTGTNVRPGLVGSISAKEGSQAFFRGNQFAVSKGELQFKERDSTDAFVDLNAQTQVREYLVTLKAFGRLSEPKIILSSEPGLPEADVLSLLTLGVTSRDTALSSAGAGLAAEALFSASGLDRQVQRFLPKSALLKDLSFHLSTGYNPASGQVEPTAQLESKFLTDRLKLNMTQPVSGRGTRAQAEYQFNERLSGRAQWDNESQDYEIGNPGLDLKLRLEWQ